jgi:hypothetical protein
MDMIIKKASSFSDVEKESLGITGIPADWPVESFPYADTVPEGFEQISEENLLILKSNNQASYDAWVNSFRPLFNKVKPPLDVITMMEKDDKTLQLACIEASFTEDECILQMLIPGNPGAAPTRFISEGYCFTNIFGWGDKATKVELVDIDGVYTDPGTVLGAYHDVEVATINQGSLFWAEEGGQGGIDVNALAGYGKLPGGVYLRITIAKASGNNATKAALNIYWGSVS